MLDSAHVKSPAQHPGRIGRAEDLEIPLRFVKPCSFGDRFASIQHVPLAVPRWGWKDEWAEFTGRVCPAERINDPLVVGP